MASMRLRKYDRVHHLPCSIYEDNYGYSINYYQPMIDYLDAKYGGKQAQYPHLPWTFERGFKKYRPSNSVAIYTAEEINRLSRAAAARADQILLNARVLIRTPFSVKKIADASRITKHIQPDSVLDRTKRRQIERDEDYREREFQEVQKILRAKRKMDECKDVEMSQDLKRAIRGKSASAITAALLADSERNIKTAKKEEEDFVAQTMARSSRAVSENKLLHSTHIEFMDERLIDNLDYKVSSSLCNVKRQLSTLNQKTYEFYADSRCVPDRLCYICNKVNRRLMPR